MLIEDLLDMKFGDVLDEFCIVFSPECDYFYGIARWDDVMQMWDEFELDEEYCFDGDNLLQYAMEIDFQTDVLDINRLREILDYIGIKKKAEGGTSSE